MTTSTHLKLPFILPAQAGKHITHNEAIAALDTLAQLAVLDRDLAAPPASPATGARYIVGPAPSGAWAGKANHVAAWDGAAWVFHAPEPGWLSFVLDENGILAWSGSAWASTVGLDGKVPPLDVDGPVRTKPYAVASVPPAVIGAGQIIFVSDEAGGATLAFSDGTDWRRVSDRAIIS